MLKIMLEVESEKGTHKFGCVIKDANEKNVIDSIKALDYALLKYLDEGNDTKLYNNMNITIK